MTTIVRRRKLGMSSARGICDASETGIQWCLHEKGVPYDDVYIRWGCTAPLSNPHAKVINTAKAIKEVNDKIRFRRALQENGCTDIIPRTYYCPRHVTNEELMNGVILRPRNHAQGKNLHLVRRRDTLLELSRRYGEVYISQYVPKQAEFRVFVAQGRAVWVAEKTPGNPEAIAWNVAKGGRFDNVRFGDWNLDVVDAAIRAFNVSNLHFGGVDVMVGRDGNVYVIEINSAPSQTSPYRQSCVAKLFDFMINENDYERIDVFNGEGKYLKYIHPAIDAKAKLNEEDEQGFAPQFRAAKAELEEEVAFGFRREPELVQADPVREVLNKYFALDVRQRQTFIQEIL